MSRRWPLACFAALGIFWGAWAASLPDIRAQVGASDGELGLALLFAGAGALPAMLLTGRLWRRAGWWLLPVTALFFAIATLGPALAATPLMLAAALVLVGAGSGALDVAMNAAVSDVEATEGARLMYGAHATFSLAVLAAAVATGLARDQGARPLEILVTVAALIALVGIGAIRSARAARRPFVDAEPAQPAIPPAPRFLSALTILALLCAAAFLIEDAMQNWSALHVERTLGAGPALGGAAPGIFAAAMFLGRSLGQRLGARFTERALLSGGAAIAALGVMLVAFAPAPMIALAGLALGGAGISLVAPALFSRAGRLSSPTGRGAAIARLTVIGYTGFVVGPGLVGALSELGGLRIAIAALALLAGLVAIVGLAVVEPDDPPVPFAAAEELVRSGRA